MFYPVEVRCSNMVFNSTVTSLNEDSSDPEDNEPPCDINRGSIMTGY